MPLDDNLNLTWEIGDFRIYVAIEEEDKWQWNLRHREMGWEISAYLPSREAAIVDVLGVAEDVQFCNHRRNYTIDVNGKKYLVNAMPQNTIAHVIYDVFEQSQIGANDKSPLAQYKLVTSNGIHCENHIHIQVFENVQPLILEAK